MSQRYRNSLLYFDRAKKVVPTQAQTFSKSWTQYPFGASPIFASKANGGYIWDLDGNRYIDWPMALGPIVLGHNYPAVVDAIRNQCDLGIAFSLPHKNEVLLAEKLSNWFPYADMARFGKNGSDATTGAVRAARALTGRELVLCCGYHGWHDWFVGTTSRHAGVPKPTRSMTLAFPYNDLVFLESLLEKNKNAVAAIVIEPIGVTQPAADYLKNVRLLADKHGAILIFDECWTGFRLHRQGSYGIYGVEPDLACFGKALGNGVPISAVVGRTEFMSIFDEIFFSFTFGGDMLGISAAIAVLEQLTLKPVIEHIEEIGSDLINGTCQLIETNNLSDHVTLKGYPGRHVIDFLSDAETDLIAKSYFQQEVIKEGILGTAWHAPCYSHTNTDVSVTLDVYDKVFRRMKTAIDNESLESLLEGRTVEPVFRKA